MKIKSIYITDDDQDDRLLISNAVKEALPTIQIKEFDNGTDLLSFLFKITEGYSNESLPEVILLDLVMPKIHGRSVLDIIKGKRELKKIKVFVITGSEFPKIKEEVKNLGADGFYIKPNSLSEYINIVKEISQS